MNSLIANLTGVERIAVGAAPIQARAAGAQEPCAAGFAGMLLTLLGGPRPAVADRMAGDLAFLAPEALPADFELATSDEAPAGQAMFLSEGMTDVCALAATGRPRPGLNVGREPQAVPQGTVAGTDFAIPASAPGTAVAARSDISAGLLPLASLASCVAAGADRVAFLVSPGQTRPQVEAAAPVADVLPASQESPSDLGQLIAGRDQATGEQAPAGRKPEQAERPAPVGSPEPFVRAEETSLLVRAVLSGAGALRTNPAAVPSGGKTVLGRATGEENFAGTTGRDADAGAREPRPATGSESSRDQTAYGGEDGRPAPSAETSVPRRLPAAARFDGLDSPVNVASPGGPKVEGEASVGPRPQAEHVISTVLDRVESAKAAGREEARFEIRTADGQAVDVKISVHRNAVRAQIGVSTTEMREALACRIWELGQRLESGGLTPESIEVVLLGDWSEGSRQGGQRRPPKQRTDRVRQDSAAATLVEAERSGFEHWV